VAAEITEGEFGSWFVSPPQGVVVPVRFTAWFLLLPRFEIAGSLLYNRHP
jgi:hypothetical protein